MRYRTLPVGVALSFAVAAGLAAAADVVKSSGSADVNFIVDAAQGAMAEVELGQLASQQAQNDEVKKFGQKMVTEHGRGVEDLKTIAKNRGITLPSDLSSEAKSLKTRLTKLHGAAFDRAYMRAMLSDHRKDIQQFKKESTAGRDGEVKKWATMALPMLEEHLKSAQAANTSVVAASH
jgi:putative membrane protein